MSVFLTLTRRVFIYSRNSTPTGKTSPLPVPAVPSTHDTIPRPSRHRPTSCVRLFPHNRTFRLCGNSRRFRNERARCLPTTTSLLPPLPHACQQHTRWYCRHDVALLALSFRPPPPLLSFVSRTHPLTIPPLAHLLSTTTTAPQVVLPLRHWRSRRSKPECSQKHPIFVRGTVSSSAATPARARALNPNAPVTRALAAGASFCSEGETGLDE